MNERWSDVGGAQDSGGECEGSGEECEEGAHAEGPWGVRGG
jgi:hypothetical protein